MGPTPLVSLLSLRINNLHRPFIFHSFFLFLTHTHIMDVFIPQDYVIKRRMEKKEASPKRSHRNANATETATHNTASSSTHSLFLSNAFPLLADNLLFTSLSA
ncbi:hypothetical protein VNO77_00574 [Canavalia gladiata]|uniref:Uncharacterized protein n=1 Tax=Canavalia gladiata TaxID=3824 RepID=A0AAN9MQA0_CANGL